MKPNNRINQAIPYPLLPTPYPLDNVSQTDHHQRLTRKW
jgi:hypothetical protein